MDGRAAAAKVVSPRSRVLHRPVAVTPRETVLPRWPAGRLVLLVAARAVRPAVHPGMRHAAAIWTTKSRSRAYLGGKRQQSDFRCRAWQLFCCHAFCGAF